MADDQRRHRAAVQLSKLARHAEAGKLRSTVSSREIPAAGKRLEWVQVMDPDGTVRTVSRVVDVPDQPMIVTMGVPNGIDRIVLALPEWDGLTPPR